MIKNTVPNNMDASKFTKKVVSSDAWPEEIRKQVSVADVHTLIPKNIDVSEITYKLVDSNYLSEVKQLHEEWFPVYYNQDYYENLKREDYICMGAFWNSHLVGICITTFKQNLTTKNI